MTDIALKLGRRKHRRPVSKWQSSKNVANYFRGKIRISYSPGVATQTSLSLRRALSRIVRPTKASLNAVRAVIAMSKPHSVLIVDDEPNILLSLQFLMKKSGYEVRTAKDGEEALAEILHAAPDLVLLDVMMPKIDGFSMCERIRANPAWQDMRIIMLTARGRDVEREKGLALGADDYITKPFSTKDAIARVEAVLARPRGAQGVRRP